jgi:regulatory protein
MKRQITDIQVQKNNPSRRSIFLDGKFFCGVSEDAVVKFRLKRNMEIDETELRQLIYEEELSRAKNYAYRILARRMYTNKEIRDKLEARGYAEDIIQDVITTLERYGYLDDNTYAEEWVLSKMRTKPKGKIALRQELKRKGIKESIIEDTLAQVLQEEKETDIALNLARRRIKIYKGDDPQAIKRKLYSFLGRRGFNFETVKNVIHQVMEESETEPIDQ